MYYNPHIHHRHSIRLKDYNYSNSGIYFITICTKNRECILSNIINHHIQLKDYGIIVRDCILKIPIIYPHTDILNYVIMPNHIHILFQNHVTIPNSSFSFYHRSKMLLPKIIQQFKSATIKMSKNCIKSNSLPPLYWQRNYYEHIVRNERDFIKISEYINNNPMNWQSDILHM